jgi:1,4-alpha-glucan branching enzyme
MGCVHDWFDHPSHERVHRSYHNERIAFSLLLALFLSPGAEP